MFCSSVCAILAPRYMPRYMCDVGAECISVEAVCLESLAIGAACMCVECVALNLSEMMHTCIHCKRLRTCIHACICARGPRHTHTHTHTHTHRWGRCLWEGRRLTLSVRWVRICGRMATSLSWSRSCVCVHLLCVHIIYLYIYIYR